MKITDPKLRIIKRELEMKAMSPIIAVFALVQAKQGLAEIATVLECPVENVKPIYDRLAPILIAESEKRSAASKSAKGRAHPLPKDWQPSPIDEAAAKSVHLTDGEIRVEVVKFVEYWTNTGKTKIDWPATWRTWVTRCAQRLGRLDNSPPASGAGGEPKSEYMRLDIAKRVMRDWQRTGIWERWYGPEIGRPGCKIPPSVIAELCPQKVA